MFNRCFEKGMHRDWHEITIELTISAFVHDVSDRRKLEKSLLQSKERLLMILNTTPYAYIGINKHGTITEWNLQAMETFGWSREGVLKKDFAQTLLPSQYHRQLQELLARSGEWSNKKVRIEVLNKQQSEMPAELDITSYYLENDIHFSAFVRTV